jgi:FMN phosphatase YigB (HAD superfamily)
VTAQQVRSYKPDPAHFKEFARRIGGKKGWVTSRRRTTTTSSRA